MLDRAEAQVLRLSMFYALLDGSPTIGMDHLIPALAFWRYTEQCVHMLCGDASGDEVADTLLEALRDAHPKGLSREQVRSEVFQRHKKSEEIERAIRHLQSRGRITEQEIKT